MNANLPTISCLCITRNSIRLLQRAINCFNAQTYPNRELVILYESNNVAIKNYLKDVRNPDIAVYEVAAEPKLSLGALRNISVEKASGTYFCQWDDDDWYASNRLQVQYDALIENCKQASMLSYWLMYDGLTHTSYLSSFRLWEGSILCEKSAVSQGLQYANMARGEDTFLLRGLMDSNCIFPLIKPTTYIYVFHGNNTWDYNHFNVFYKRSLQLSASASNLVKDVLEEKYSVEMATDLLNSDEFLKEIIYRYDYVDNYSLNLI